MDLKKTWERIQLGKDVTPELDDEAIRRAMYKTSHGPIHKIGTGFTIKLGLVALFTIGFLYLGIVVPEPLVSALQLFMAAAYLAAFFFFLSCLKQIRQGVPMDGSLLASLKNYLAFVKKTLRLEEKIALFIYPVALTAGFLLGFTSAASLDEFFSSPRAIILLIVCWVLLTPLSHLLARWMNRISFGKYLRELEEHISELES